MKIVMMDTYVVNIKQHTYGQPVKPILLSELDVLLKPLVNAKMNADGLQLNQQTCLEPPPFSREIAEYLPYAQVQ